MLHKKGFTLIELLVVMSIIGLLAAIILASLNGTRSKGRDSRRVSDIKQIQLALSLYYDQNSAFPSALSLLQTGNYINPVPTDPTTGNNYNYQMTDGSAPNGSTEPATCASSCTGYILQAQLENSNATAFSNGLPDGTHGGQNSYAGVDCQQTNLHFCVSQ